MSISTRIVMAARHPGFKWLGLLLFIGLLVSAFHEKPGSAQSLKNAATGKSALVELYTSEGCSSCPAAEELLPSLRQGNVYVLEFHVDYWDRLGWKDPFSNAEYSDRQRSYARRFRLSSIYTPEAVINGKSEQVGSDRDAILSAITAEVGDGKNPAAASLQLTAREKNGKIAVSYIAPGENAGGKKDMEEVFLALVQKNAVSKVGAGENRGRVLNHVNIVRSLKLEKTGNGSEEFVIPDGVSVTDLGITGWIQETNNGEVKTVSATSVTQ